jgi:polysaccharide biosynthesis/export protein
MRTSTSLRRSLAVLVLSGLAVAPALGQAQAPPATPPRPGSNIRPVQAPGTRPGQPTSTPGPAAVTGTGIATPTDYVIGPDDVLGIVFWRDTDMTGDVTVRPDGLITLPLLREIKAAGLTPEQLREQIQKAAAKFIEDPNVSVVVRQINSRNVFITGSVVRPGGYPVSGQMQVLQLIAIAGGLTEFADGNAIITRVAVPQPFKFNYNDVSKGKKLEQNIVLKPGDTVIVR